MSPLRGYVGLRRLVASRSRGRRPELYDVTPSGLCGFAATGRAATRGKPPGEPSVNAGSAGASLPGMTQVGLVGRPRGETSQRVGGRCSIEAGIVVKGGDQGRWGVQAGDRPGQAQ